MCTIFITCYSQRFSLKHTHTHTHKYTSTCYWKAIYIYIRKEKHFVILFNPAPFKDFLPFDIIGCARCPNMSTFSKCSVFQSQFLLPASPNITAFLDRLDFLFAVVEIGYRPITFTYCRKPYSGLLFNFRTHCTCLENIADSVDFLEKYFLWLHKGYTLNTSLFFFLTDVCP